MNEPLRGHPSSIDVDCGGKYFFLGSWPHPRDGEFNTPWNLAMSGRAHLGNYFDRAATIDSDKRLSADAKRDDALTHRMASLKELGVSQRDLTKFVAQIDERRRNLARIEPPSATDAIYDVELARMFRETTGESRMHLHASLVSGEHAEMVTALMRSPRFLWPMPSELRDTVVNNWVARRDPEGSALLGQLSAASHTAQHVLSRSVTLLSEGLSLEQRMTTLGDGAWQKHVRDGAPEALGALAAKYKIA